MKLKSLILTSVALTLMSGCATFSGNQQEIENMQAELAKTRADQRRLNSQVQQMEAGIQQRDRGIKERDRIIANLRTNPQPAAPAPVPAAATSNDPKLPPQAKPGECYARVYVEPTYTEKSETKLLKAATEKVEVVPARYEWVEKQVLVEEASEKVVEVVPARYETVTERVLVREGYTTWKKGRGPIEKLDDATGEIMCLVEVPPEYKTVTKKVLASPPQVNKVPVPAKYKTIKVRKLVEGPREVRTPIPAQYQKVTKTVKVTDGRMEWRPVLCETNTTPGVVKKIQTALKSRGYNPGNIDGVIGSQTMAAVRRFQKDNGLPSGQLTMATIRALGVQ